MDHRYESELPGHGNRLISGTKVGDIATDSRLLFPKIKGISDSEDDECERAKRTEVPLSLCNIRTRGRMGKLDAIWIQ